MGMGKMGKSGVGRKGGEGRKGERARGGEGRGKEGWKIGKRDGGERVERGGNVLKIIIWLGK